MQLGTDREWTGYRRYYEPPDWPDEPEEETMVSKTTGPEYHVGRDVFDDFDKAAVKAMSVAIARGEATIDVVIYSEEDAREFGGDDAVERYREDPDASVFERVEIKVNLVGRVP